MIYFRLFLFLFLSIALWQVPSAHADGGRITPDMAHNWVSSGDVILIDIRRLDEWKDTGVPKGAVLISMHEEGGLDDFEATLKTLLEGDKSKPIAFICAGGVRSRYLQWQMEKRGFTKIYDVSEGMVGGILSKGWIKRGLPTISYDAYLSSVKTTSE